MKFSKLLKGAVIVLPLIVATACTTTAADKEKDNSLTGTSSEQQIQRLQQINTFHFDYDKYNIKSEFASALDAHADFLRSHPSFNIVVEGYTDERGTPEYNIALGERRAAAVKAYLQGRGVSANQISIVSFGKEKPAVLGHDAKAYEQNRRAVIVY